MSEVEKMYENAGVEPKAKCNSGACIVTNPSQTWCKQCESLDYTYPPFTAEKQLSLIKWLFEIPDISNINIECENKKICIHNILGQSDDCDTIEDALASYINDIWQDLTEQERTEIKRILE